MDTIVVTGFTENMDEVAATTVPSWESWASIQGYGFEAVKFTGNGGSASWNKIKLVHTMFMNVWERVFWVDVDSMVINSAVTIESLEDQWYSSQDGNGLCNSHMLVKRTVDSVRLLETLLFLGDPREYDVYHTSRKHEQDTLKYLEYGFPRVEALISYLPQWVVHHGQDPDRELCVHLPCIKNKERVEIFNSLKRRLLTTS